jgi:hypothetical protein
MTQPIDPLDINHLPGLSNPARRALSAAGCTRLEDVARFSEAEIKKLHGIGPNAIETLRRALAAEGLSFAAQKKADTKEK